VSLCCAPSSKQALQLAQNKKEVEFTVENIKNSRKKLARCLLRFNSSA
jgi:hypothetical protein